ncbi:MULTISPECIES: Gfo/Idh/MocA family oxidoreductase [Corallincola]|uniref:Gfo/Idh/MocA family oxidoreductase n=3 Tax=Corallincola TaxID=1775176 RepID=A0A368NJY7_9GAMM|nr:MULTISPECIES: Gfo/Idh/MocA family oxidoreductase [Corallincola]RCU50410.1 gfo/Idh/MocA family oxidoreductase [Corallincola holothuriorum]TAA48579.1 Gfo/Idh/MocA family oxidoreductase [Corallincola spongiicola]TCI05562.1 Gfo/Idh/MocA family oxidoreductase [Corallincola luteus]
MKVGIIGTSWGRVHVGTFREAGHEIAAIMGVSPEGTARVASEEGIPVAATDVNQLDHCDIIVVASPTATHLGYLKHFSDRPVLCEKPLSGARIEPGALAGLGRFPTFVNYPFSFLQTASVINEQLAGNGLGPLSRAILSVGSRFPMEKTPVGWFLDIVAHPLSYLIHSLGPFTLLHHHIGEGISNVSVLLENEGLMLDAQQYRLPETGIQIHLTLVGEQKRLELSGGFRPGDNWRFNPVLVDGQAVNDGEWNERDIWYSANCRVVEQFVDVISGRLKHVDALANGLFDLPKAAQLERSLDGLLAQE